MKPSDARRRTVAVPEAVAAPAVRPVATVLAAPVAGGASAGGTPPLVDVRVDKGLPTPAYLQLRDGIKAAIEAGAWGVGMALPSERDLASHLGLSRMTVRRAFEELVADGLVEGRQGSGTFVRARRLEQTVDRVIGFTDEARMLGFRPGSRVLEFGLVEADAVVAAALRCPPGALVLRVARIRTADGQPLALQVASLRPSLSGLEADALERFGSLYRAVATLYGVTPRRARQTIGARLPTREERRLLALAATQPVLALERTTFDGGDEPFEYVRSAYRGDRYALALDLRAPDGGVPS
jgi:GntR family transcriptional regulator